MCAIVLALKIMVRNSSEQLLDFFACLFLQKGMEPRIWSVRGYPLKSQELDFVCEFK